MPPTSSASSPADSRDFLLPLDIDADEVVKAIKAKLGDRDDASAGATPLIQRKAGGRVAVAGYHILRLGDGRFDLGRRFMHTAIRQIRAQRMHRLAPREGATNVGVLRGSFSFSGSP